jgi:uncharacterized RDD family membrane protein YckC
MSAKNLQGQYAGFASRLVAFVLDTVIVSLTIVLTSWLIAQVLLYFARIDIRACPPVTEIRLVPIACNVVAWGLRIFAIVFPFLYLLVFWMLSGQTVGHYALGLRVVRMKGGRITLAGGIFRIIGYLLSFLTLGLGFLLILASDRRRGMHDWMAGTCVIYAWEAQQDERLLARIHHRLTGKGKNSEDDQASETAIIQP